MVEILETEVFSNWLRGLRDREARARILVRLRRLSLGNAGDARPVGSGLFELRIDWGPGYRIYCVTRGSDRVVLLGGGDKRTQAEDIRAATALARRLEET